MNAQKSAVCFLGDAQMSKETMTSRQRMVATLNRKPVDRYPIDLGVHFSTGISAFAYYNLRRALGLSCDNIELAEPSLFLARVDEDVRRRFHIDTILLNPPFVRTKKWSPRAGYSFVVPDGFNPEQDSEGRWVIHRPDLTLIMAANGYHFDGGWIDYYGCGDDFDAKLAIFAKSAERIYKETDYFTMMMGFSGYFHGLEFACDMLTDPDYSAEINSNILKAEIEKVGKLINAVGDYIDAIEVNSDLGTQQSLLCTPQSYQDLVAPYLKKFIDFVHQNSDYKVYMHSCGAISELIPILIQCGVDALNPVQVSAKGMDLETLKSRFGNDIVFWGGGCDTQNVLGTANPETVAEHTRKMAGILKRGGGFVFSQVHNIQGDVPPENIIAMLDEAYNSSFYGEQ